VGQRRGPPRREGGTRARRRLTPASSWDAGFVATTLGKYDVFLGGDLHGRRLNELYAPNFRLEAKLTGLDLERASPQEVLEWTYRSHGRVAIVASFQAESSVLIDMACSLVKSPDVLTLDTGRLPEATYQAMAEFRNRYPIRLRILFPESSAVEEMTAAHGPNLFRSSVELRHHCCEVRKVRPLARALSEYDAWITGLRRDQSRSRAVTPVVSSDAANGGIVKVAPLATWSHQQVWDYIEVHGVPTHPLYARGYRSIGCEPCTRATGPDEDERAGRWWWEQDSVKECGLHPVALEAAL
jgi:thioredoxin-dependent adenylylsulfate APS reductase